MEKIYGNLGFGYQQGVPNKINRDNKGKVQYNYYSGWGFGVIDVNEPGENNFHEIKQALFNLLFTMKAEVIYLYIPLEDNDISGLVEKIEQERFFFCGITPSYLNGKDVIRFEYLNGTIDSSKIKIYGKEAQEIFSYILNEKEKTFK